jgi:hypothetical protein
MNPTQMIDSLVNGMLLVATEDLKDKIARTLQATPNQKIAAIRGGERGYYCQSALATDYWHRVANEALELLRTQE